MKFLPKSRQSDIVVQELGKELLIYDLLKHRAFQLNETSKIIFEACGENRTFEDLQRHHQFSEDLICLTLDTLKKDNLLSEDQEYHSSLAGISRRDAIRKVGLATMIALPLINSITSPFPIHAASGDPDGVCTPGNVIDPDGFNGLGGACRCETNIGVGNTCDRGDGAADGCKTGCFCLTTVCPPPGNPGGCSGVCQ